MEFTFDAPLWLYEGDAGWHFISLPEDVTDEIDDSPTMRGGFGSVRVEVQVGSSVWRTSIFPSKNEGTFILPVKKPVRAKEGLSAGDMVTVHLVTLD